MSAHSVVAEGLAQHDVPFPGVLANFALAALAQAGYAVVKLPEPVHHCAKDTAYASVVDQLVTACHSSRRQHVRMVGTAQTFTPEKADELAGALSAAAAAVRSAVRDDRH